MLGKHTDYAGGATLTCAVERGVCAVYPAAAMDGRSHRRHDRSPRDRVRRRGGPRDPDRRLGQLSDDGGAAPGAELRSAAGRRRPRLPEHAAGVGRHEQFERADHGGVPRARRRQSLAGSSGLPGSTSTALPISRGTWAASRTASRSARSSGDHGVGTFGGSEDHTAILCSEPGHVGHFEFCPGRRIATPAAPGRLHVRDRQQRDRRAEDGERAGPVQPRVAARRGDPAHVARGDGRAPRDAARGRALGPGRARAPRSRSSATADRMRSRRPISSSGSRISCWRTRRSCPPPPAALAAGDVDAFGRIADESQRGRRAPARRTRYPRPFALARLARELGAAAASAFGAGFGGSVWALVPASRRAASSQSAGATRYQAVAAPRVLARSSFFLTAPGPPATPIGARPFLTTVMVPGTITQGSGTGA